MIVRILCRSEQLVSHMEANGLMQSMRQQLRLKDLLVRFGVLRHFLLEDHTANQSYGFKA